MSYVYDIECHRCHETMQHYAEHWISSDEQQEIALKTLQEHYREKHMTLPEKRTLPPEMNVLPGQRIGWDKKSEYLGKLAEYSANGYLTQEEWDARVKWVENASTQEEIDEAFKDLKWAALKERLPKPRNRNFRIAPAVAFLPSMMLSLGFLILDIMNHELWAVPVMALILAVNIVLAIKMRKAH